MFPARSYSALLLVPINQIITVYTIVSQSSTVLFLFPSNTTPADRRRPQKKVSVNAHCSMRIFVTLYN